MIRSFEEAVTHLQAASGVLFRAAVHETGCSLSEDQTAALAGALRHLTLVATRMNEAERN